MISPNNKDKTLADVANGQTAKVASVLGVGAVTRRLMEMGIVPGELIRVVKAAPFGDPMEIKIRGYHLAVRRNEARMIEISDAV